MKDIRKYIEEYSTELEQDWFAYKLDKVSEDEDKAHLSEDDIVIEADVLDLSVEDYIEEVLGGELNLDEDFIYNVDQYSLLEYYGLWDIKSRTSLADLFNEALEELENEIIEKVGN